MNENVAATLRKLAELIEVRTIRATSDLGDTKIERLLQRILVGEVAVDSVLLSVDNFRTLLDALARTDNPSIEPISGLYNIKVVTSEHIEDGTIVVVTDRVPFDLWSRR